MFNPLTGLSRFRKITPESAGVERARCDDLELATVECVDVTNRRRILHDLGRMPPAEFEDLHYRQQPSADTAEYLTYEHA